MVECFSIPIRTLIGNPGWQWKMNALASVADTATGSGRNGNEAVAGAPSQAFARWHDLSLRLVSFGSVVYGTVR